jgi:hypothetical protein
VKEAPHLGLLRTHPHRQLITEQVEEGPKLQPAGNDNGTVENLLTILNHQCIIDMISTIL